MTTTEQAKEGAMPMFYRAPRPLDRQRDADLRLSRPTNFRFAAGTNAIPLVIDEFPMAAAYYPIVFAAGPLPIPAAVVGLRTDQNAFVDTNGRWRSGCYIPSYVRRYPFILVDDPERKQFVLCIDEQSDMLGADGEFPLFEGDGPSEFTKSAMEFCAALRQQGDATDDFIQALQAHNMFMRNDAQIDLASGARLQLSGFFVIDPKQFDALPDNIFVDWRAKGWIGLVYSQLLSSHRWQTVVEVTEEVGQAGIPTAPGFSPGGWSSLPINERPRQQGIEEFRLLQRPTRIGTLGFSP
jgi:SapC